MPKLKPHKGVRKRFRVTSTGKVLKISAGTQHIKSKMSSKRKRRLRRPNVIAAVEARRLKRLLGMM